MHPNLTLHCHKIMQDGANASVHKSAERMRSTLRRQSPHLQGNGLAGGNLWSHRHGALGAQPHTAASPHLQTCHVRQAWDAMPPEGRRGGSVHLPGLELCIGGRIPAATPQPLPSPPFHAGQKPPHQPALPHLHLPPKHTHHRWSLQHSSLPRALYPSSHQNPGPETPPPAQLTLYCTWPACRAPPQS